MSDLVKVESQLSIAAPDNRFEAQKVYLQQLIDGKMLPKHISDVKTAFLVAEYGRELGFGTLQAFQFIIPITGRLTLSAKAIGALMRSKGIDFECTEDALWVYGDGETAESPNRKDEKPVDRRTTIMFYRNQRAEKVSFYWSDAVAAGLTTKDNWQRMKKEMMYARALTKGANRIAQDVMLGLYETGEILDYMPAAEVKNINPRYNDEGGVEEVNYSNVN